jgi:hypothetical protein
VGTNQLLDLTDDSSSHSSEKRAREDNSSSSGSSGGSNCDGGNSLPIDLTAETSIELVVKKELTRLSKGVTHLDLTL